MAEFDTRQSLLIKIRDPQDSGAWNEFVDLYTPLIYRFSASRGVGPDDRPDVVQEIFTDLWKSASQSSAGVLPAVAEGRTDAMEECIRQYGGLVWTITKRYV